jgi:hypothetical protein
MSYPSAASESAGHLHLLTLASDGRIEAITAFLDHDMVEPLGLPDSPV